LETGDPSLYLVSGVLKSIDSYGKYLIDEIRRLMRVKELKASRTRVTLAWSVDRFEMRGDRLAMLTSLSDRLRDYIGDVNIMSRGQLSMPIAERVFSGVLQDIGKANIVVICSEYDYRSVSEVFNLKSASSETVALKADLLIETSGGGGL